MTVECISLVNCLNELKQNELAIRGLPNFSPSRAAAQTEAATSNASFSARLLEAVSASGGFRPGSADGGADCGGAGQDGQEDERSGAVGGERQLRSGANRELRRAVTQIWLTELRRFAPVEEAKIACSSGFRHSRGSPIADAALNDRTAPTTHIVGAVVGRRSIADCHFMLIAYF
jgi:hypothetical protein